MAFLAIIEGFILTAIVYYTFFYRRRAKVKLKSIESNKAAFNTSASFIQKLKSHNRKVIIFYGSQTGTAEDFAMRLSKNLQQLGVESVLADPLEYSMPELASLTSDQLALFFLATYGEGEPTDNAKEFIKWLKDKADTHGVATHGHSDRQNKRPLESMRYGMFGLGNKTYEFYNVVAVETDKRLLKLGAQRIGELGLGDGSQNVEEDYLAWEEDNMSLFCDFMGVDPGRISHLAYSFKELDIKDTTDVESLYTGEIGSLRKYERERVRKTYDAKQPYEATIASFRLLNKGGARNIMHIVIDSLNSGIRYQAGDHLAIYPKNSSFLVEKLGKRLSIADLDRVVSMLSLDHINSLPKSNLLKALATYAEDAKEKQYLSMLSTSPGKGEYQEFIASYARSIVDVLEIFSSVRIPTDHLMELLPRLQCRYYSISSSPRIYQDKIHITAVHLRYETKGGTENLGVTTDWLCSISKHLLSPVPADLAAITDRVPIFIRKSNFKLPRDALAPVIMIGPGCGIAPFMGFIQERKFQMQKGAKIGPMILFHGCRKRSEDYLYEEELSEFKRQGVLSRLEVAFSREQDCKFYVQDLLKALSSYLFNLVEVEGGYIYVCGDAKNMTHDVNKQWISIFEENLKIERKEADRIVRELKSSGRYLEDAWI